jgi:hypothetical protein
MSGFHMASRVGHLNRLKCTYGYLLKMKHAAIRVRTEETDYSDLPDNNCDLTYTVYGKVKELVPEDAPQPQSLLCMYVLNRLLINTIHLNTWVIRDKCYMFGDNNSMVDGSMQLNAKLRMWHTKTIASEILVFYFLPGENNPVDILDKHWGYTQIKERLKTLLFWRGDTANMVEE